MKSCLAVALSALLTCVSGQSAAAEADCTTHAIAALDATPSVIRCLLDSGRPSVALLLAQRLVAAQTDDPAARALLTEALAALNAGPAALEVSAEVDARHKPLWRDLLDKVQHVAWIGVEIGRDSNINSATSLDTIPIPLLNYRSLRLDPLLVQRSSGFLGINAGAAVRKPVSSSLSVGALGAAAARLNSAEYSYLPHSYLGQISLIKRFGEMQLAADLGFSQEWVARYRFLDRLSLSGRASTPLGSAWNAEISASAAQNRYPQFNGVQTVQTKGSAGLTHVLSGISATIHSGEEKAAGSIKDLDRRFVGYSLNWRGPLFERGTLVARVGAVRSEYLLPSPLFATQRLDTAQDIEVAYMHQLDDHWSLTPRVIVEQNSSSIPLVTFKRRQGMIELRRIF